MNDTAAPLGNLRPENAFFIGVDSDGCVFDSMELKHRECFCPAFIGRFGLQRFSREARETWEFVNLYSASRGVNRFAAVLRAVDLLRRRLGAEGASVPRLSGLRDWVSSGANLSNGALERELGRNPHPDLETALLWSRDVNDAVERIVKNLPPFAAAVRTLEALEGRADLIVVSQTPVEAIEREWREHGMTGLVREVRGQEAGSKAAQLDAASGGKYGPGRVLMVGDAPGDAEAAFAAGALFYPIIPRREEESWERLEGEGLGRFFEGSFKGGYQEELLEEFGSSLPERAPWDL